MQTLFNQFSQVLGTTLLHSLWQGLIIYAILRLLFLCIPSASSNSKYNMALLALAASVLWPAITFMVEINKHPFITPITDTDGAPIAYAPIVHAYHVMPINSWQFSIDNYMPYLVVLWFIGIVLSSARLLWGWHNIYRIKQNVNEIPVLTGNVQILLHMLNISKKVGVFLSEYIDVPCIIGYLKPMIILPAGIITQFSAEQIQSILAHEVAHIRRNDYFINVLQQVVSILFFFNPFTYLINKIIYSEREHCCDDLVLQITGQPLIYAQTLLQLEENRRHDWQLALAATGKKHYLLNRIKRIMETKKQVSNIRHIAVAALLLIGSMGTIAWLNPEIKSTGVSIATIKQLAFGLPDDIDTTKKMISKQKTSKHNINKSSSSSSRAGADKVVFPKPKTVNQAAINYDFYSDNPTLRKLSAEVSKHSEALSRLYDNPEYKNLEKQLEIRGHVLDSLYNRPELKKLQESMESQSKVFEKMSDNPEMKELEKKMEELGKEQSAYFESKEYKQLQKNFEEQGKWFEKENASKSPDFEAHSKAFKKAGEDLRNYTSNSQYKAYNEQLKEYGKKMHDFYNSPEYIKQREAIKQSGEELRKAYQDPAIKQQQQQLNALSKQLRDYNNGPQLKKEKELLNLASAHLREYTNSPAFKLLREQMEKNMKAMYRTDSDKTDTTNKDGK